MWTGTSWRRTADGTIVLKMCPCDLHEIRARAQRAPQVSFSPLLKLNLYPVLCFCAE
mgnify:CR=1 FL=1